MPKRTDPTKQTTSRTLGRKAFAAISAVEGLKLSREGKQRVERNAPLERRREDVVRAYMEPKAKR